MPRTITALGGLESGAAQIPVSLVRLEIPGAEKRMHDLDVTLYLNPSTNAVSIAPGAGLLDFTPYAGLSVPQIELGEEEPLGQVSINVSNVDEAWFTIMAANAYRETPATIWQGNLSLSPGTNPNAVTFQGVVTMWAGKLVHVQATREIATLQFEPPDPFNMTLPWRTYGPPGFTKLPVAGTKIVWGYTEKTV